MKKLILIIALALISLSCTTESLPQQDCDCYIVKQIRTAPTCEELETRPWTEFTEGFIFAPQFNYQHDGDLFGQGMCQTNNNGHSFFEIQTIIRCF